MKFMFDTNIFNHIIDEQVDVSLFKTNYEYLVTHIQFDELNATKNEIRKSELLKIFKNIEQEKVSTNSAAFDISDWDNAGWGDDDDIYTKILEGLNQIKNEKNNIADSLIAETAIKNEAIFVTDELKLRKVVSSFGYKVFSLLEFISYDSI